MRTCQSCGKENPDDQDFCSCGEYLRWEPTGYAMPAITPEQVEPQARAPRPASAVRRHAGARRSRRSPGTATATATRSPAAPPAAPGRRRRCPAVAPPGAAPRRPRRWCATCRPCPADRRPCPVPPPPRWRRRRRRSPTAATSCPRSRRRSSCATSEQGDYAKGAVLEHDRRAGRARPRARADPQPERHRRQLRPARRGHPGRLVVDLPRHGLPRAVRRRRDLRAGGRGPPAPAARPGGRGAVVGAQGRRGLQGEPDRRGLRAAAPAHRPVHRDGHRPAPAASPRPPQGHLRRHVVNKANAPVLVALDGEDPDGELQFGFNRPPQEIPPGGSVTTQMQVKPPKQIWIGRGKDRQLSIRRSRARRPPRAPPRSRCRAAVLEGVDTAAAEEEVVPAQAEGAARAGHVPAAHLQAAAVPAGRAVRAGRHQRADAADARPAGARARRWAA